MQFTVQPARITVQFIVETAAPEGCMGCSAIGALSFNTTGGRVVAVATQQGRVDTGGGGTRARGACGRGVLGLDGKRRTTIWGITTRTSAGANFSGHSRLGGRCRRKGLLVSRLRIPHDDVIVGPVVVLRLKGSSADLLGRVDATEKFVQGKFNGRT